MPVLEETGHKLSPSQDQQDQVNTSSHDTMVWVPISVNSHLYHSARLDKPDPSANLSDPEMKSRRRVSLIMAEMVQTERDYVRALQLVIDHYMPELKSDKVPQTLLNKKASIFGNLEKIYHFHSESFLKLLEKCHKQPFLVGQLFLQHKNMFQLYPLYNKNKPKSDQLMMECGKNFFRQKQLELGDKMDLSSYLLKPVQRLGKYALMLKQLLKECAETELEYSDLKAAEAMMKFQLRHGNDLLALGSLSGCNVDLQGCGRLLRQDEFLVFHGHRKSLRRIFLFEDRILFSKTRRARHGTHDTYTYKKSFKTVDIGLTENYGDCGCKFEIRFHQRSVGHNYVLQAPNSEVKKCWVEDLSLILWRQAILNKESQRNNLATMGTCNKPCLDLQPSEDNIHDRNINVLLSREEGQTGSVKAVSPHNTFRNGQKRPHSIISVSSTSSSGSSQSSFGLPGSLNMTFGLSNSPEMSRRCIFLNESAITAAKDTSVSSLRPGSRTLSYHPRRVSAFSSVRSYLDFLKSRVLKQKQPSSSYTDV